MPSRSRPLIRRLLGRAALLACLVAGVPLSSATALESEGRAIPESRAQAQLSFAPLVKRAGPAVVNIYTQRRVQQRLSPLLQDPFFQRFFGDAMGGIPRERVERSLGSGVILAADGLIVTNAHVIKDSDEITVVLADRREFPARLIASDEQVDLAVLRIEAAQEKLPFLKMADSDGLEVGDMALAIGNPFGVGQTVTSGIISAVARTAVGISDYNFFIQTDAAINPGNSGGALIGMDGQLIGINTAIFSRSGGSVGIGFAIPSNMVRTVVDAVRAGGKLVRPWMGAGGQPVTAEIASSLGLSRPAGVLINKVRSGSPASQADLRTGDVVVAINDKPVDDPDSMRYRVATLGVGGVAQLSVFRQGKAQNLTMRLAGPPENPPRDLRALTGRHPLAGAKVANLNPALVEEIRFDGADEGVVTLDVAAPSPAASLGLRPGDVIVRVNEREIRTVKDLADALAVEVRRWSLSIRRGDQTFSTVVNG
jgi:Do/DeqQ family serine protease